jgi:ribosome-associated protein
MKRLELAPGDVSFTFIRATGPGGQNVNKVASAALMLFDLTGSGALSGAVKLRLRGLAGHRLTADGSIQILARNHRTQEGNKREALDRLHELIARALVEPKIRHKTRPTRGSVQRRLEGKGHRRQTKRLRGRVGDSD